MYQKEQDIVFYNAKVYTMKEEGEVQEAIAFQGGKISFLGTTEDALKLRTKKRMDLNGDTVIPGMTDSHLHLYAYCQNKTFVNLEDVKSIEEMIDVLNVEAKKTPLGDWIKGVNFDQNKFLENRFPTRQDLDKVSTEHPILIKRVCLHAVVANSKALELAGVVKGYNGGSSGIVETDETGNPNGILREQSTKVFDEIIPDPLLDLQRKEQMFHQVLNELHAKGITGVHTYAAKIWNYSEDLSYYQELEEKKKLDVRVTVCFDELFEKELLTKEQQEDPYHLVQQGAYKLFSDGSLGSRSAALKQPYSDDPQNKGFVVCSQEELNEKILIAYERGLQPAIHAIGDRALDMVLDAIQRTLQRTCENGMTKEEQNKRLPFRIIHVQMVDEELLEKMKDLPLILDIQPIFLCTDLYWLEERIGAKRVKTSYAWKTLKDRGFMETGGSDCPVESFDPLLGIFAAVSRRSLDGFPENGYNAKEKLSRYDAVALFTKNPPYATGQQAFLGTLEEGKFADMVILDRNIFTVEEMDIPKIKVKASFVAGKKVYEQP